MDIQVKRAQNVLVDFKLTKNCLINLQLVLKYFLLTFVDLEFICRLSFDMEYFLVLLLFFSEFYSSSLSSSLLLSNVFFVGAYICNSLGIT